VKLAKSGAFFRTVRPTIDNRPAHSADAFPAIMVKRNGFLTREGKLFVDNIQHFQKRHIRGYILGVIGFQLALIFRALLAPDL
jgi:hypothetical protein